MNTSDEIITTVFLRGDRRVAGLPTHAIEALAWRPAFDAIRQLQKSHAEVQQAIEYARAVLHEAIATLSPEAKEYRELIKLRRSLNAATLARRMELPLGYEDTAADHALQDLKLKLSIVANATKGRDDSFDMSRHEAFRGVLATLKLPIVRHGLFVAAPEMVDILENSGTEATSAQEKVAMRAWTFLSRAATKTSPYSTFTVTQPVDLRQQLPKGLPDGLHPVYQIDGRLWSLLIAKISSDRVLWPMLEVTANSSITTVGADVLFLGPLPTEPIRGLPLTGVAQTVIAAPSSTKSLEGWLDLLVSTHPDTNHVEAEELVAALVEAGLLTVQVPIHDDASDAFLVVAEILEHGDHHPPLASACRNLHKALQNVSPPDGSLSDRRRLDEIRRATELLRHGLDGSVRTPGARSSAALETVHESVFGSSASTVPPIAATGTVSGSLQGTSELPLVAAWLRQFDPKLPGRLAVQEWASSAFPDENVPLLEFYKRVNSSLRSHGTTGSSNLVRFFNTIPVQPKAQDTSLPLPLQELAQIRERSRILVEQMQANDQVQMSLALVETELSQWPSFLADNGSFATYVQQVPARYGAALVLNSMHGGFGRGRARTDYLLRNSQQGGVDQEFIKAEGMRTAGYSGAHGSSLNLHAAPLEKEILYPFTTSRRANEELLTLGQLTVRCAEGTLMLVDSASGEEVLPVHVGMLADYQLPPLARFIERIFARSMFLHPSSPPFASNINFGRLDQPHRVPRIQVGSTIIQRSRCIVPASSFGARPTDSPQVQWSRFIEMIESLNLKTSIFARAWGQNLSRDKAKSRKPMHVNVESWWSVKEFLRHSVGADFYVFDEALPDPMEGDSRYVDEILIESSISMQTA